MQSIHVCEVYSSALMSELEQSSGADQQLMGETSRQVRASLAQAGYLSGSTYARPKKSSRLKAKPPIAELGDLSECVVAESILG